MSGTSSHRNRAKLQFPLPWVLNSELEISEGLLQYFKPRLCLEWGSGGSTLYFPRRFPFIEIWVSIEHDKSWFERVNKMKSGNVILKLFENEDEYVWSVFKEFDTFDFIFIDGIYRESCMEAASKHLKGGGICLLHDSSRRRYHPYFSYFDHRVQLSEGDGQSDGLHLFWNG